MILVACPNAAATADAPICLIQYVLIDTSVNPIGILTLIDVLVLHAIVAKDEDDDGDDDDGPIASVAVVGQPVVGLRGRPVGSASVYLVFQFVFESQHVVFLNFVDFVVLLKS